jgi:hypothetical protein
MRNIDMKTETERGMILNSFHHFLLRRFYFSYKIRTSGLQWYSQNTFKPAFERRGKK